MTLAAPRAEASGLYVGVVTHQRRRPRKHALKYRVFMLLLDLDEVEGLTRRLRLLTRGRFGLASFRTEDHGDRSGRPLRAQVEAELVEAGLPTGGPIRLLTMPRVLGHGFNPLSVIFCHAPGGALQAIWYEVSNTFGDRHVYLLPVEGPGRPVRQTTDKRLYVSPFMDMGLTYRFSIVPPEGCEGEQVGLNISVDDDEGPMLTAAFTGRRRPLTDGQLLRAWITHPLLTLKVVAGIHWEALFIFLKGVGFRHRPPPPDQFVTHGRPAAAGVSTDVRA